MGDESLEEQFKKLKFLVELSAHKNQNSNLSFDTLVQMDESDGISPSEPISDTVEKQLEVEDSVQKIYDDVLSKGSEHFPALNRKGHLIYTNIFLHKPLPSQMTVLDASHCWILYWLINATSLLGGVQSIKSDVCQNCIKMAMSYLYEDEEDEGFGGGYMQTPHLADTYAMLCTLAIVGDEECWSQIDRKKVYHLLLSLKNKDGSFAIAKDSETDTRSVYCALCTACMLNILDDELKKGVEDWIVSCQTYEGGFAGNPGDEAHSGYTFCAIASLCILKSPARIAELINVDSLLRWLCHRQYAIEGGLSGRTNKLVDGCYSHWGGGTAALLECISGNRNVINRTALQNYILCCCQAEPFGLVDKPGKYPDFYHTNYVLCGLSACQHYQIYDEKLALKEGTAFGYRPITIPDEKVITIDEKNLVEALDPVFVAPSGSVLKMRNYYRELKPR